MTIIEFMNLFAEFRAASWGAWRRVLASLTLAVHELYVIAGRGSGKSRVVALLACAFACRPYPRVPGERVYVGVFAPDRKQAGLTFRYITGLLRSVPALAALVIAETRDSVELSTGVVIEVITASVAAPRGRAYALAIIEEAAFLPSDSAANPDIELLRAVRPALARVPGSLLCVVSSPYSRRGVLWAAWQKYHGQPAGDVLLVQAPTLELNPTFDARAIEAAYEEDPASAAAEFGAQFRSDVEDFVSRAAVDAAVVPGRWELPPVAGCRHLAFLDFAGGSGQDSATLAVAHAERRGDRRVAVLDVVREVRPPFSPEEVCEDFASTVRAYGGGPAVADRYAGQFPVEQMRKHGVTVRPSALAKSEVYREFLPLLNSRACELLDVPRLRQQLLGLERRASRGGRDAIDHAPGQHDDVINAAAGALVEAAAASPKPLRLVAW